MDGGRSAELQDILDRLGRCLPSFADGRIDYTDSSTAPVVTIIVAYGGKMLIMKRSETVGAHTGKWNSIAGYIDERAPIKKKVLQELAMEAGIRGGDIASVRIGKRYTTSDRRAGKRFIVYPALVRLKRKPRIRLNWENTDYAWVAPDRLAEFDTVPGLSKSLMNAYL